MNQLWAPWRMSYILSGDEPPGTCIFCAFPSRGRQHYREHLILCVGEHAFVIMNKYPYNNGHVMVVPRAHVAEPGDLGAEEYHSCADMLRQATRILRDTLRADGINIGMNLGRTAGAGIEKHCHWHIVPRWNGDTNFMPVIADTKVMSEHLQTTYERLLPHLGVLGEGPGPERDKERQ